MGNGPDRRKRPRYGLYRTEDKAPPAATVARVLADLPREYDRAAVERALKGTKDKAIIIRNAQLDLRRMKALLESFGIPAEEMVVPDRRAEARKRTLGERVRSMLGLPT